MRLRRAILHAAAVGYLLIGSLPSLGQVTGDEDPGETPAAESAAPATPPEGASRAVEDVEPPIYWLPGKNDSLQPVINIPLEEFTRLLNLKERLELGPQAPPFAWVDMSFTGQAAAAAAEFEAVIRVRVESDDWVRVPLRMPEATLHRAPRYTGPGDHLLTFEEDGGGLVCWLRGKSAEPHELRLDISVPLSRVANEQGIELTLPNAPTSQLAVEVKESGITARASEGAALEVEGQGPTRITATGLRNDFELWWRSAETGKTEAPNAIDATGTMLARVDSRSVSTEAALTVESRGGPLDRFQVRLPVGARLVSGSGTGCTVRALPGASKPDEPVAGIVEVRMEDKTRQEVDLRLVTEQAHDSTESERYLEFAGFEVIGAVRQSGYLAVHVLGDWQVNWGDRRSVRQVAVDELPVALRGTDLAAGFEYLNQPCSLTGRVIPRRSRVGVDPQYTYLVEDDRLLVEARLRYTIRGARVFALEVSLPEASVNVAGLAEPPEGDEANDGAADESARRVPSRWEIDEIGPANLVDLRGVFLDELTPLSIPLLQPVTGEVELKLVAHVALPPGTTAFEVALPRPVANSLGPAAIVVSPADNVELLPRADVIAGLSRQQAAPQVELPERQQAPFVYRGDVARGRFAADMRVRSRTVSVAAASRVYVAGEGGSVDQQFDYEIAYVPLDTLELRLPRAVAQAGDLEVRVDGERAAPVAPRDSLDQANDNGSGSVRRLIPLPAERIGRVRLTVRYALEHEPLASDASTSFEAPLVLPVEATLVANELSVAAEPNVRFDQVDKAWQRVPADGPESASAPILRLTKPEAMEKVKLVAHLEAAPQPQATLVERAWIQSWLGSNQRQDRAVFRFTSSANQLQVALPDGVAEETVEVLLDGQPVASAVGDENRVVVGLPGGVERSSHIVEMRYAFAETGDVSGPLRLDAPQFVEPVWVRRTFWQLILPSHVHVVAGANGYVNEFEWGWQTFHWGRRPILEQFQLENWADVPHRTAPAERTNRYLFSSLGPGQSLVVRTSPRWLVVLGASGAALFTGLALIYLPVLRRGAVLLVVVLIVGSIGVLFPEQTILFGQAASLGLVLTLVAGLLERGVARRRGARPAGRHGGSSIVETSSKTRAAAAGGVGSQTSTDEARIEMQISSPQAER